MVRAAFFESSSLHLPFPFFCPPQSYLPQISRRYLWVGKVDISRLSAPQQLILKSVIPFLLSSSFLPLLHYHSLPLLHLLLYSSHLPFSSSPSPLYPVTNLLPFTAIIPTPIHFEYSFFHRDQSCLCLHVRHEGCGRSEWWKRQYRPSGPQG